MYSKDPSSPTGYPTCTACPPGKYNGQEGKDCTFCVAGTYAELSGATSCQSCDSGEVSLAGSTSSADCNQVGSAIAFAVFAFIFMIIQVTFYLRGGRFERVAFLRQERAFLPLVKACQALYTKLEDFIQESLIWRKNRQNDPRQMITDKTLRTVFLFLTVAVIIVFIISFILYFFAICEVLYFTLILARGMISLLGPLEVDIRELLHDFVLSVSLTLRFPIIEKFLLPFTALLDALASTAILYCTVLYSTVQYRTVLYSCTVISCTVLFNTILVLHNLASIAL